MALITTKLIMMMPPPLADGHLRSHSKRQMLAGDNPQVRTMGPSTPAWNSLKPLCLTAPLLQINQARLVLRPILLRSCGYGGVDLSKP
jgi:hypothetical protein